MTRPGNRSRFAAALAAIVLAVPAAALVVAVPAGAQTVSGALDCAGPVPDAEPNTAAWLTRDAENMACALQRHTDQALHPVSQLPASTETFGLAAMSFTDAYREPSRHAGARFRFRELAIINRHGEQLDAEVYRPCGARGCRRMRDELRRRRPPYPAVIVLHGGGSRKELHWWASQALAEAGYMTVAFNGAADNLGNAKDVLDWLRATPRKRTRAGQFNPFWRQLDRRRIGLAGHSRGGQAASVLGQRDGRVKAIVSWDRGSSLALPDQLDTPTLFFVGEYECQANPICQPEPYLEPPRGEGPGSRGTEYDIVRRARVESMKLALRASTHLDWTPSEPSGNRYVEPVSVYFTLAWFDRYLKGRGKGNRKVARRAYRRLTGKRFDGYADRHNISQGLYDPVAAARNPSDLYAGNVPYSIAGREVANLLSFYFRSKCFLTAPGNAGRRAKTNDLRENGCRPVAAHELGP